MKNNWIPISKEYPPDDEAVLISTTNSNVTIAFHDICGWWECLYMADHIKDEYVVAWMPLPEPYVESEE